MGFGPTVVPVTFTDRVHELAALTEPPLRLMVVAAAPAENVPPQVSVAVGELATCRPLGKVSLNETPLRASEAFGLLMVKLSVEIPFSAIVVGENDFVIVAGVPTLSVAWLLTVPVPPSVELTAPVVFW